MLILPGAIDLPWTKPKIAVLEISGAIGTQVRAQGMVQAIKALREDNRVEAVIIEIDSPGGSAPVSDAIHRAVTRLSAKKPTVAYIGDKALSGGYLIASAAREIHALPTALVGSIGVIFTRPVVEELMQKVGVKMVVQHAGKLKGMFQPWREPSPEETVKVQQLADQYYDWFVNTVATSRKIAPETLRQYATGEMFTGDEGKKIGLVDELNDFDQVLDYAKTLVTTAEKPRLTFIRPRRPLLDRLMARSAMSTADAVAAKLEERITPRIDFR